MARQASRQAFLASAASQAHHLMRGRRQAGPTSLSMSSIQVGSPQPLSTPVASPLPRLTTAQRYDTTFLLRPPRPPVSPWGVVIDARFPGSARLAAGGWRLAAAAQLAADSPHGPGSGIPQRLDGSTARRQWAPLGLLHIAIPAEVDNVQYPGPTAHPSVTDSCLQRTIHHRTEAKRTGPRVDGKSPLRMMRLEPAASSPHQRR